MGGVGFIVDIGGESPYLLVALCEDGYSLRVEMMRSSSVGSGNLPSLVASTIRPNVPTRKTRTMSPHTTTPIKTVVEKNMMWVGLPTLRPYRHADDLHACL